jgi:hypothetical protein
MGRLTPLLGGLRLTPRDGRRAARDVVLAILGVVALVLLLDAWLFRAHLPPDYVELYTSPLVPRTFFVIGRAALEEIEFRLVAMTGLVVLVSLARVRLTVPVVAAIIVASQFANVAPLVLADPLYASLRYWAIGCVWGWLYWRHGFLSALIGHGVSHLLLDPLLLFALQ